MAINYFMSEEKEKKMEQKTEYLNAIGKGVAKLMDLQNEEIPEFILLTFKREDEDLHVDTTIHCTGWALHEAIQTLIEREVAYILE